MIFFKIFIVGWIILLSAIVINFLAVKFEIYTWYQFLEAVNKNGLQGAFKQISLISKLFLFIVYPFVLGLAGFLFFKIIK